MKTSNSYLIAVCQHLDAVINRNDYNSIAIGAYIETVDGEFCCIEKPNIYQPIDSRRWVFEQTADADGEPCMDGQKFILK